MNNSRFRQAVARLMVVVFAFTQVTEVAALTLMNIPLTAATTATVRPNLMYVLDNSGSMAWSYTPDYIDDSTTGTDPGSTAGSPGDTVTATLSGDGVGAITRSGTAHVYSLGAPTVNIVGGGGTGAAATVTMASNNTIQSINVTTPGSGYTSAPYVVLTGGLPTASWKMCWGVTSGKPNDTTSPTSCTSATQPPYASAWVNYQYYDPRVQYVRPFNPDRTRYDASVPTAAYKDGFDTSKGTVDLTNNVWPHEVWCNVSTATPNAADPTAGGKCKENADTSSNTLYPNATYAYKKTFNGPPSYYVMGPSEYCTDDSLVNCVRSTSPTSIGATVYNVPAEYRWCSYYNPFDKSFGSCQGRRDLSHVVPNYLGGWQTGANPGSQANASLQVLTATGGQRVDAVTIGGVDVVGGRTYVVGDNFDYLAGTRAMTTTTDIAQAICESIQAFVESTGYGCGMQGSTAFIQAAVVGTAANTKPVVVSGPADSSAVNANTSFQVVSAPNNSRIDAITVTRTDGNVVQLLSASVLQQNNSISDTAVEICNRIKSGPQGATYEVRSRENDLSDTTPWGTCNPSSNGFVEIRRATTSTEDNGASLAFSGPTGNAGEISVVSTVGATRITDITVGGGSILAVADRNMTFADGTNVNAVASEIASRIAANSGVSGCTANAVAERVIIGGSCNGALAVSATAASATGTFRVRSSGNTSKGDLANITVGGTQIVGHVTGTQIVNTSDPATNAATLRALVANGFSAAAPVQSGAYYDVTVTAPAGNTYNGVSFGFGPGTAGVAAAGESPVWTFPITGATTDNVPISSITCGGTTALNSRSTGTTSDSVSYVQNLAVTAGTNGLNGKSSRSSTGYTYACSNASMVSPQYRCTVTGPVGAPACASLNITKDASISLSTTTPAAVGGSAGSGKKWTLSINDAQTDSKSITGVLCGTLNTSPSVLQSSVSTGTTVTPTTTTYAQVLATAINNRSDSQNGWNGDSNCSASGTTVSCRFERSSGLQNRCDSVTVTKSSGATMTVGSVSENWTGSRYEYLFDITNVNQPNESISQVACNKSTFESLNATVTRTSSDDTDAVASKINDASDTDNGWDGTSSCSRVSSGVIDCEFYRDDGLSNRCTGGVTATGSGITIGSFTEVLSGSQYRYEVTFSNFGTDGDRLDQVTCSKAAEAMNSFSSSASTGSTLVTATQKVQRLENLRTGLNGQTKTSTGTFAWSCPTPATSSGFSCDITSSTATCTSTSLRMVGTSSSGIYAGSPSAAIGSTPANYGVTFTDASGGSSPVYTFDIQNATADNATISSITCGATEILPTSAPTTGTSTGRTYQRINNLTGATISPSANGSLGPTNGYTLSCTPASSGTPTSTCTLTGPLGAAACNADAGTGFVINKDSSITIGTVERTNAGSDSGLATEDFAPYLSTQAAFSGGYAAQQTAVSGIAVQSTIPVSPNPATFSNYAPSATLAVQTNTAGTAGNSLNMANGQEPSATGNEWKNVGVFKRVDIVPTTTSYNRYSGRSDCAGTTCTYTEELQNFANWYTYYRTRMQMMKSATSIAFEGLGGDYRIGFDDICNCADKACATTVQLPAAQFVDSGGETANQKTTWWSRLTQSSPQCNTPLRSEAAKIGRYYSGKLTVSGAHPDPVQYSCQQNFMILVTDGYWNESDSTNIIKANGDDIANVDNVLGTAVGQVSRPYYDGAPTGYTSCGAAPGAPSTSRRSTASSCRNLSDVAQYYYQTDLRDSSLGNATNPGILDDGVARNVSTNNVLTTKDDKQTTQHMNFYALGLGIDGLLEYRSDYQTSPIGDYAEIVAGSRNWPAVRNLDPTGVDDLWHAAVNGRGKYFSARNLPNVVAGLREALNKIGARVGASSAAATSNLEPVNGDNFAYVASYETLTWTGDVQSRQIDITTGVVSDATNCGESGSGCVWSAQKMLDNQGYLNRRVYVAPTTEQPGEPLRLFNYDNLTGPERAYFDPSSLSQYASLVASNSTDLTATKLIDYLRGDRRLEADGKGTHAEIWRLRSHLLGDIVNTQPVFNKAPDRQFTDEGYSDFKTNSTAASRRPVVYVAAQDGMLHALNAHTAAVTIGSKSVAPGEELWAYIPKQALANLKNLADFNYDQNHRFYFDGTITVSDVNFGGSGSDWHTILVAGMGAGGTAYIALDVTDPLNPSFLWEFTDTNLGYTYSNPTVAKLPSGEWAVLFTSGYSPTGDGHGRLFALNPQTGTPINASFPMSLGDMADSGASQGTLPNNLGKAAVFVENPLLDRTAQYVYTGDLNGNLWRFDLNPASTGHSGTPMFKLAYLTYNNVPQAISTRPEITTLEDGTRIIFVGTGQYLEHDDLTSTTVQGFYAIKDMLDSDNKGNGLAETWVPQTDRILNTDPPPVDPTTAEKYFLERKFISIKDDNVTPITETVNGVTSTRRAICAGKDSKVSASSNACINQTGVTMDWQKYAGWFVTFPDGPGERMNVDMKLVFGTLKFGTNVPGADSCTVGGHSFDNSLDYLTGLGVSGATLASTKLADSLIVGITVIKLGTGEYKAIVTKSNYQQETTSTPIGAGSGSSTEQRFQSRRTLWREREAY